MVGPPSDGLLQGLGTHQTELFDAYGANKTNITFGVHPNLISFDVLSAKGRRNTICSIAPRLMPLRHLYVRGMKKKTILSSFYDT
jgi:hypothetical protein